jgi:hypothetical protein
MREELRGAFVSAFARLFGRHLNQRPDTPQNHRNQSDLPESGRERPSDPTSDILHTEWAAFQTLIREIHKSDKEHHAAEEKLWASQHQTAKRLNWITAIGTGAGFIGSLGIIASFVMSKIAADDSRDALHVSQRPWVVAHGVDNSAPADIFQDSIGDMINLHVVISLKNTGISAATETKEWPVIGFSDSKWQESHQNYACDALAQRNDLPPGVVVAPGEIVERTWDMGPADDVRKMLPVYKNYFPITILGCVKYFDQFNISHTTKFCFEALPLTDNSKFIKYTRCFGYHEYAD